MLTSKTVRAALPLLLLLVLTSFVNHKAFAPKFSGTCTVYVENNLSVQLDNVYTDSDIDAINFGDVQNGTPETDTLSWSTDAVTIDVYIATIPRGGGTFNVYHNNNNTTPEYSVSLSSSTHYYTWIDYNPPNGGTIKVKLNP